MGPWMKSADPEFRTVGHLDSSCWSSARMTAWIGSVIVTIAALVCAARCVACDRAVSAEMRSAS